MRLLTAAFAALVLAGALAPAHAQNYPTRPVRIIVGFPPGGGVDIAARIVAQGLTEVWSSQNALVDNRPGPLTAGKVRGMAVTSAARNARIPNVPTVAESGLPGYDVSSWYGICTQAAVPKPILSKLQADLTKALTLPATSKRLNEQGIDIRVTTPEEFVAHVRAETEKWTKVVRAANIPMQ